MPDCAWVLRVQGGLEVGRWGAGEGEPAPSPKPLGNKIPTLSAAVWQGYARQGFSEKEDGAWSQALPPPPLAKSPGLEVCLCGTRPWLGAGASVCERVCVIIPSWDTPLPQSWLLRPQGLHGKVLPGVLPQFFALPRQNNYSLFCSLVGLEPSIPEVYSASSTQEEAS